MVASIVQAKRREARRRHEQELFEHAEHCHAVLFKNWDQELASMQRVLARQASRAPELDSIVAVIIKGAAVEQKMHNYITALQKVVAYQKSSTSNL